METEILDLFSDTDAEVREEAAECLGLELGKHEKTFALITNTLAKDKEITSWRGFISQSCQKSLNFVEDEVVEALLEAVRALSSSIPPLLCPKGEMARYKKIELLNAMHHCLIQTIELLLGIAEKIIISAYEAFSPRLAEVGQRFFDNDWIDASV